LGGEDVDLKILAVLVADGTVGDVETGDAEGGTDKGVVDTDGEKNELLGLDDKESDFFLPSIDKAIGIETAPAIDGGSGELATDDAFGGLPSEFGFEKAKL